MSLPEKPIFALDEVACDWRRKFKKPDLNAEDLLCYGIDESLAIHARISGRSILSIQYYCGRKEFKEYSPGKFNGLSEAEKNQECFLLGEGPGGNDSDLVPFPKDFLENIFISSGHYAEVRVIRLGNFPNLEILYFREDKFDNYPHIYVTDLYVLRKDKTLFEKKFAGAISGDDPNAVSTNIKQADNMLLQDIIRRPQEPQDNNEAHKSFSPELAIANEMWNHFYRDGHIQKGAGIGTQVKKWLKKNKDRLSGHFADESECPTEELCKRLSRVINPKRRKGGGVESVG